MFDKYCIEKILAGGKTVTRRLPKGKRPAVPGKSINLKWIEHQKHMVQS